MQPGKLYLGDNLEVLRERIPTDSIDLIYLDPPFNSQRDYNVLFAEHDMSASKAQIKAFGDSWTWDLTAKETFRLLTDPDAIKGGVPPAVADIVQTLCRAFPSSRMAAYIVMMAVRLLELHRVLKPCTCTATRRRATTCDWFSTQSSGLRTTGMRSSGSAPTRRATRP